MNYKKLEEMLQHVDEQVRNTILSVLQYEESKMHQVKPMYKKDIRKILEEKANDYQRNLV